MMKKLIVLLGLLATTAPCFALKEYYALSRSIRALGMGGAFYGLSDDEYALFYNPAGLSLIRTGGQGMLDINIQAANAIFSAVDTITKLKGSSISQIVSSLQDLEGKPMFVDVGLFPHLVFKHFAIGLLVADTKVNLAILGKGFDSSVDMTAISDSGLVVGYGSNFFDDNLHLGATLKGLVRGGGKQSFTVTDIAAGTKLSTDPKTLGGLGGGVDIDLGATYDVPTFLPYVVANRVSVVLNNLLASQFTIARQGGTPPGLIRTFSLGGFMAFQGYGIIDNINLLLDFAEFQLGGESNPDYGARTGSFFKHVNLGVEIPINGSIVPRFGIHQGYFTAGLGLNVRAIKLELATYAEEDFSAPGRLSSRRVALKLAFGVGSAPPPPLERKRSVEEGLESATRARKVEPVKPAQHLESPPVPKPVPAPAPVQKPVNVTPKEEAAPKHEVAPKPEPEAEPEEENAGEQSNRFWKPSTPPASQSGAGASKAPAPGSGNR